MPLFKGFFVSLQSIRGWYASIISTIVDFQQNVLMLTRLVCFNNFYYCRFLNFSLHISRAGMLQ